MEGSARPHVAMIVGNDVTADTRVKKTAASLDRHGYRVTVLGLSPSGSRTKTSMGEVEIIRLPVDFVFRNGRRTPKTMFNIPRVGYASKHDYVAAKRRVKIAEREFLAYIGRQRAHLGDEQRSAPPLIAKLDRRRIQSSVKARRLIIKARRRIVQHRELLWRERSNDHGEQDRGFVRRNLRRPAVTAVRAGSGWRRLLPEIDDYELSFGPVLDELEPDVIHAHDVHMIGIAERAVARARLRGRRAHWIYDAHEYVPGLARYTPRVLGAYVDLESEYIRRADRVITVSEPIAEELMRSFGLQSRPRVVMNAPLPVRMETRAAPSVREAAGLPDETPLLVYSGGADATRGVHTLVEALPLLRGVHLALVVKAESAYVQSLRRTAEAHSCEDRLHVVPFVSPDQVVPYLASATAAVHPLTHYGNHEVALPNKLFEYLHARLPVIVSDVKAMSGLVLNLGIGEVFRAEDPASLAQAAAKVLADPDEYRRPVEEDPGILRRYSWPTQEKVLLEVYSDLLGRHVPLSEPIGREVLSLVESKALDDTAREMVVAFGPRNMAGQGWEWAKALERCYPGLRTRVFTVEKRSRVRFPTDVRIPAGSWKSLEWQLTQVRHVLETYTHVLLESGSGLFGTLNGLFFDGDLPSLQAHDIKAAVVLHGSEVRDPRRHRELEPYSPFNDSPSDLCELLQAGVDALLPRLKQFDGPLFVTTMDLLDYVPDGLWLPVAVNTDVWAPGPPALEKKRPVVVHAPSHAGLKGSQQVEKVVKDLDMKGLIEYRRVQDVPPEDMPEIIATADVVLDQFALGDYGAVAVQAMAAGRVVIGHVHERVRSRLPENPPIVEATADSLGDVLQRILDRRAEYADAAGDGPAYVRRFHDGAYSAAQLAEFLGDAAGPLQGDRGTARSHSSPR